MGLAALCSAATFPATNVKEDIIGTWAMLPLYDGTANVVEFRQDSSSYAHEFTCDYGQKSVLKGDVEKSFYTVSDTTITLTADGEQTPYTQLRFDGLHERRGLNNEGIVMLGLTQQIKLEEEKQIIELPFLYQKQTAIVPLCTLFFKLRDGL